MTCLPNDQRGRCSNHGYYCAEPQPHCVCDQDWNGAGCFALFEGSDCGSHDSESAILWYVTLIITTLCLIPIVRLLWVRCVKQQTLLIVTYDAKSLYPLIALLDTFAFIFFAILKIIYGHKQLIGRDIAITFGYTFAPLLCIISLVFYFFIVIKFLMSLTYSMPVEVGNKVAKRFNILTTFVLFIPPFSIVFCAVPFIGIGVPQYRTIFAKISLIGMGFMALIYGLIILNALGFLLEELSSHINSFAQADHDIKIVYKRLKLAYYLIANNSATVAFTYFVFGFYDFLLKKTTYLFVYQLCSCALGSIILILTISGIPISPSKILPVSGVSTHGHSIPLASQRSLTHNVTNVTND
mmetsp:Transcript_13058/g.12655  ORF Transcript_13058/g.12655 Transcript_13058/m.12655 type:complete len:354 (+) Transcript_13058:239-1300(+)